MNKFQLVQEFISTLNTFDDEKDWTLKDFCNWYLQSEQQKNNNETTQLFEIHDKKLPGTIVMSILIRKLSKFLVAYSKKALHNTLLNNVEDYAYLRVLENMPNATKTSLINEMTSEFTSGIEIIKRLIKMNLVQEFQDEEDKRSKILKITDEGRKILIDCDPHMSKVSDLVFGELSNSELATMFEILNPINEKHSNLIKKIKEIEML